MVEIISNINNHNFLAHIATLTSYDFNWYSALTCFDILCAYYRFIVDNSLEAINFSLIRTIVNIDCIIGPCSFLIVNGNNLFQLQGRYFPTLVSYYVDGVQCGVYLRTSISYEILFLWVVQNTNSVIFSMPKEWSWWLWCLPILDTRSSWNFPKLIQKNVGETPNDIEHVGWCNLMRATFKHDNIWLPYR
jgi:hypothetical protein